MKMKTKIILLLLVPSLFLQGSCIREDNGCPTYSLPKATQTGKNTIGCKVNGVVCVPRKAILLSPITKRLCYNDQTGDLSIRVDFLPTDKEYQCGINDMSVSLSADELFNTGVVNFESWSAVVNITPQYQVSDEYHFISHLSGLSAELRITKLDRTERIISGTFHFEGYYIKSGVYDFSRKVYVTHGCFDILYNADGSCIEGYEN